MAVKPSWITQAGINDSVAVADNKNKLKDSLSYLAGLGASTDAYTYLTNIVLRPSIITGIEAGLESRGEILAIASLRNAMTQRDLQNASEKSMWLSVSRSLATFFEGFVIAVVPFVPIIMFIGNTIGIVVKYLQVLLWVQLWSPVMTICNLYITKATAQAVQNALQGTNIGSFNSIETVEETVQHWIGVGGMLAGLTPVLALFIISGSIYTFNSLVSRISGADHFNEKGIAPDLMQQAPLITNQVGAHSISSGAGNIINDTQANYAQISLGDLSSASKKSSDTYTKSRANSLQKQEQTFWQDGNNSQQLDAFTQNYVDALNSANNKDFNDRKDAVKQFLSSNGFSKGWSDEKLDSIATALTGELSGGLNIGLNLPKLIKKAGTKFFDKDKLKWLDEIKAEIGGKGSLGGKQTTTDGYNYKSQIQKNWQDMVNKNFGGGQSTSTGISISKMVNSAKANAYSKTFGHTTSSGEADSIAKGYNQLSQSSQAYELSTTQQQSVNSSMTKGSNYWVQNIDEGEFTRWMGSNPDARELVAGMQNDGKGTSTRADMARLLEWSITHQDNDLAQSFLMEFSDDMHLNTINGADRNIALKDMNFNEGIGGRAGTKIVNDVPTETENEVKKLQEENEHKYQENSNKIKKEVEDGQNKVGNNAQGNGNTDETHQKLDDDFSKTPTVVVDNTSPVTDDPKIRLGYHVHIAQKDKVVDYVKKASDIINL